MIIKNPLTVIKGSGGIPWNIRASAIAPTGQGNAGDIVVLTDLDVTSISIIVYVWDTLTNAWISYAPLFIDTINFLLFMGADITVPDYFGANGFNVTESPVITSGGGGQVYP